MEIKVDKNVYNLELDDLVVMANRANNPKRGFLFVSKVLGKHLETEPNTCRAMGYLLASQIYEDEKDIEDYIGLVKGVNLESFTNKNFLNSYKPSENTIVIGFAETATGLGMAVASAIEKSYYFTTTREPIKSLNSILRFEEEHSHATTHKCFLRDTGKLKEAERVILVDDEITTGKSMINIIKELKGLTRAKKFTILSILDWRDEKAKKMYSDFMVEENLNIELFALISGTFKCMDFECLKDNYGEEVRYVDKIEKLNIFDRIIQQSKYGTKKYLKQSGRFGVSQEEINNIENNASRAAKRIEKIYGVAKSTLVLGHGENIYIPSRVASYLHGQVRFKTTTRSPIYCNNSEGYPIKEKNNFSFEGVTYYFYNKYKAMEYDRVILLTEDDLKVKLTENIIILKL